tara:strand:- start:57 stop:215 length:159 start_codon:yes stop_codon:yes gene_type:complete
MEDLKIYGINISAIVLSALDSLNPILQSIVLASTATYTIIRIIKNLKGNGKS